ncbi:MAG: flagellar assembly protein A, partial [Oscillospiraceae bacterium]|nr:flagellar assembly protein A [Oscillospiraceae bacterium]
MIFFSKDKQTKKTAAQAMERVSSPDSDSAAKPSSAPAATSPDEEFALQTPEIPMSKLAQLLGIRELENNEAGSFFIHGDGPLDEAEAFWDSLNEKALALLRDIRLSEMVSDDEPEKQEGSEYSSDMRLETHLSNNQMTAYGCIIPPIGSGRKLSLDELKDVINNAGITYGINYDLIEELLRNGTVLRIFTIAEGKPARDGEDGKVIELFAREKEISLEADEN